MANAVGPAGGHRVVSCAAAPQPRPGYQPTRPKLRRSRRPRCPWRIGFAPHTWTGLVDHLRGSGFTESELPHGGLAFLGRDGRLLDLFRDRIMVPVRDGRWPSRWAWVALHRS